MERQTTTFAALAGMPPVLLLILLAFSLAPAGGTKPGPQNSASEPDVAATPRPSDGADAETLIARVLGQSRDSWSACRVCPGGLPDFAFLVATLPDPRDSHLPYEFDRYLDAIRRAGEAAGYVLVDFHLPWREATSPASREPPYRATPGVLVFRAPERAPEPPSLLTVWLIGETPTTGVQRPALRAAFEQMGAVCERLPSRPASCDRVSVFGPSFSGSIESLGAELHRLGAADPRLSFRVISGSATAVDVARLLERLPRGSSFHATVVPDAITLPAVIAYLIDLGVRPDRIALLVEGNTSYGQGAGRGLSRVRVVPFPSQIGRLRRAYETEQRSEAGGAVWDKAPQLRRLLLGGSDAETIDVPPVFSELDSHSTEVALASNLAALSREGVQYVGLLATDVRDKLFLGQQVRRFCPGTVLFSLDADILFLHPDVTRAFEGMLVIAPYPLIGANQTWSFPFRGARRRLQFAGTNAQGAYNAVLALLGRGDDLLEYSAPFARAGTHGRPPLWISVVGTDAFWPLRVVEHGGTVARRPYVFTRPPAASGAPPDGKARTASAGWIAALTLLQGLLWSLCVLVWAVELEMWSPALGGLARVAGPLRGVQSPSARAARAVYVLVVLASCASLLLVVGAIGALGHSLAERLLYATGLLLLATLGWAALDGAPVVVRATRQAWLDRRSPRHLDDVASVVFSVLIFVLAFAFAGDLYQADAPTRTFVYLRATQLLGGLSPLPPLFLLGLAGLLWGLCALMRARLRDALPDGRFLNFDSKALPAVPQMEDALLAALSARTPGFGGLLLVALAVGVPCWQLFVSLAVPGFEGPGFRALLGVSLFIVAAGTVVNVYAFHRLWARLCPLLRRLATRAEIVDACRKLDPALSWSAMLDLAARVPAFADLSVAVDQVERLCRAAPPGRLAPWVAAHVERAGTCLREAQEEAAAGRHFAAVRARRWVQSVLARLAPEVLQAWQTWPRPEPGSSGERPAWEGAALGFLASRIAGLTRQVFAHMRGLLLFSTGSLLLVLLAVASYPIEPRGMFLAFCWTLILGVVAATMLVLTAVERDVVLSALANTTGGKVELHRDFLSRVLVHGGVPLLGLLAAQFPGVFRQVAAWLDPFLGR